MKFFEWPHVEKIGLFVYTYIPNSIVIKLQILAFGFKALRYTGCPGGVFFYQNLSIIFVIMRLKIPLNVLVVCPKILPDPDTGQRRLKLGTYCKKKNVFIKIIHTIIPTCHITQN